MSRREPTKEVFLKDVENHKLEIKLDSGIYRHLRFSAKRDNNLWFELLTWPGCLVINGDMGTWTFSRIDDIRFFRADAPGELKINERYWAEKLRNGVHGGSDAAMEWCAEVPRQSSRPRWSR